MKINQKGAFDLILILTLLIVIAVGGFVIYRISSANESSDSEISNNETDVEEIPTTPFRFAAAGDFRDHDNADATLTGIGESESDFTLALGDMGYVGNGKEAGWCDFVKQRVGDDHPFEMVAGNHDDKVRNDGDIMEYAKCLPDRIGDIEGEYGIEYYFDYGNLARMIMVSPDIEHYGYDYSEGSEHLQWMIDAINGAREEGLRWIVLGMHKNCISIGEKDCEIGPDIINTAIEMDVDLILQGHEHSYYRTKQLDHSQDCPAIVADEYNPACVSNEGGSFTRGEGTVIVVSGAGGRTMRDVNLEDSEIGYFETWNGQNVHNTYGFNIFDVSKDGIEGSFVPSVGEYTDTFSIR